MLLSCLQCVTRVVTDAVEELENFDYVDDPKNLTDRGGVIRNTNPLNDILIKNLLTIKGRKAHIRNIPITIDPTPYDDDDDDDDDEDAPAMRQGLFMGQNYERIKNKLLANGNLFVDPMFPPSDASLFANESEWGASNNVVEWKRPSEICDDPQMFVDGATRFDIKQGELGDCWLLAAMANLTMHKKLFAQVVPKDQSFSADYTGVFHFKIWQYGEWVDVVVDDYLPTRNGNLLYIKSYERNEFWSALLEKAYAKLHGSYEALKGGSTCEAMVDFSGGCGEVHELDKKLSATTYNILLKCYNRSSMICCFINPDPKTHEAKTKSGLIRGHAYSVTKVVKAQIDTGRKKGLFPLLRIRNPWGNEAEWKGQWSDHSEVWKFIPDEEKERIGLTFDNDGEFYMAEKDFMTHFDAVEICNMSPDGVDEDDEAAVGKLKWHEKLFHGSWEKDKSAGGCRNFIETFASNPQYKVVLEDSDDDDDNFCTCLISLMQKGTRRKKLQNQMEGGCLTIGFAVYRVEDETETLKIPLDTDYFKYHKSCARSRAFINSKEISSRFKLTPGTYVIIPSTFHPDQEGDFLLRVFSEKAANCET